MNINTDNDQNSTGREASDHERLVMAAKTIFDNRLGWSDGRQPYAPRELWVELGAAIYGDDDARVQELNTN